MSGGNSNMDIDRRTDNIVFATAWKPYKPDTEMHISLSTWCVECYRRGQKYEPASFILDGKGVCEKCCLEASGR